MSLFEDNRYRWRETYFVLFRAEKRPDLKKVEKALSTLSDQYSLVNPNADDKGRFESITLLSPDDFAALDVCYTSGEEVLEQGLELAKEIELIVCDESEKQALEHIRHCTARFDVLHFEEVADAPSDDPDEMLDPTALLLVLNVLAKVTGGVAIDPQSGAILSENEY